MPPPSWKPPCPLKEEAIWKCGMFTTRVQQIDKLQNREPVKKKVKTTVRRKRRKRRNMQSKIGMATKRNLFPSDFNDSGGSSDSDDKFGFQTGSDFTFESFQKFCDNFKEQYFEFEDDKSEMKRKPSLEEIEGEYWRIVEKSIEEVEVQ